MHIEKNMILVCYHMKNYMQTVVDNKIALE